MDQSANKLTYLFENMALVAHLAHHVQRVYFSRPSQAYHRQDRSTAAQHILKLTRAFSDVGIKTYATALADRDEYLSPKEAGLHPYLRRTAFRQNCGYMGSPFQDNSLGFDTRPHRSGGDFSTIILTGYNTSQCIQEAALDALTRGFNLIIPIDATSNATTRLNKEETLKSLSSKGAILSSTENIIRMLRERSQAGTQLYQRHVA
jgi:isochorismate hydrolase